LATLQPGTIGVRTQIGTTGTVNRGNRGFGNQLSVSGHRPTENNYRVNGISVNDYSNGSPGSVAGAQLGVDAIQEFSVLTSNYTAEYGRTSGGVINAITRQGTNGYHGSAYWFLRDEGLDAKSFFDQTKAKFHRNQFGGSFGGPIRKDKTFFFADYEGIRQTKGLNSSKLIVPSPAVRQGTFCTAPGVCSKVTGSFNPDPATGIDQSVLKYLPFFPLPNAGLTPTGLGNTGFFISSPSQQYTENYVTARADHKISEKDSIDFVFFYDKSPQITPDAYIESTTETFSERVMGGIEETHVFSPTLVNTVRIGYNRTVGLVGQPVAAILPIANDLTLGAVANRPAPILGVSGLGTAQGSLGSQTRNSHFENSFQFYDDAFITKSAHALKVGFSAERIQYNELSVQRPNGTFNFDSLLHFLQNQPSNLIIGDPNNSIELANRTTFFGMYLQDDWHFKSNLTLNLGIRYEPGTLPSEAHNLFSVVPNIFGAQPTHVDHLWQSNPTLHNFEPRVGFAWDPFRDGKTSVRGSFGIFDVLPGPWVSNIQESGSFPFARTVSAGNLTPGAFPTRATAALGADPNTYQAYAPDQHPKDNYAMNWSLNLQRQITNSLTATVGYVGSHTVHSPYTTDDSNMVAPLVRHAVGLSDLWPCGPHGGSSCAIGFNPNGTATQQIDFPHTGQVRPTFWAAAAHYNALQAEVIKRMSQGVQLQASYTWSRCEDTGSSGDIGDAFTNSLSSFIFFDSLDRFAPCDFHIGQNFVVNAIWNVPGPKPGSNAMAYLLGGWQLGGIATSSSGSPFSLVMGGDPLGQNSSDPFDLVSRIPGCNRILSNYRTTQQYVNTDCFRAPFAPAALAAQCAPFAGATVPAPSGQVYCANLFGTSGRNGLIGPGLFDLDFSIFKNNYIPKISESFNVQFRAEFFNVLNHANFQAPINNSTLFSGSGAPVSGAGALDTVTTDPREIQLSLKLIW
jgi:hypothetical protein